MHKCVDDVPETVKRLNNAERSKHPHNADDAEGAKEGGINDGGRANRIGDGGCKGDEHERGVEEVPAGGVIAAWCEGNELEEGFCGEEEGEEGVGKLDESALPMAPAEAFKRHGGDVEDDEASDEGVKCRRFDDEAEGRAPGRGRVVRIV